MSLESLNGSISALQTLITQVRGQLTNPPDPSLPNASAVGAGSDVDPLALLQDISSLTRAHTTKLSLVLPSTSSSSPGHPGAAATCVTSLATLIPALVPALQLLPRRSGTAMTCAARRASDDLLRALSEFLQDDGGGGDGASARGRAAGTGVVWAATDELAALKSKGVCGVVDDVLAGQVAMVVDAAGELREWIANDDDEDDEGEGVEGDAKASAAQSLKKINLASILVGAIRKRRLAGEGRIADVERLDAIADVGKGLAEVVDEVVLAHVEGGDDELVSSLALPPFFFLKKEAWGRNRWDAMRWADWLLVMPSGMWGV